MNNDKNNLRLAVLIDAENLNETVYQTIQNQSNKHGELIIRRIYGNLNNLKNWKKVIDNYAFKASYISNSKAKNGSDIAMAVDAMDILLNPNSNIEGFCIVSSDSDFTHLAMRIRENGKYVIGFGEEKSLEVLRNACHHFVVLNKLSAQENTDEEEIIKNQPNDNQSNTDIVKNAIKSWQSKDGWTHLGVLGKKLKEQSVELTIEGKKYPLLKFLAILNSVFELGPNEQKVRIK